ncbi:DNA-binding MarR family transcriptional regulator [Microbacterium sp. SORGH_AS 505]|uniref:MarR family winged helix-turn-helix transcriptional regulator n=1 Tax=Microbacterium sp. SORGH_AS_0505 TaxID=3041770 RepID=UPI002786ADF8|nr:MarR family transcriptional regulator [Microbacterium sp. SORGH_AS_0505]MDQ1127639.1 DNA-binding MarR family transcriptional regulator [Microbacterium sp. SORGH_AS_0505]
MVAEPWIPTTERGAVVMSALEAVRAFSDSLDRMYAGLRGDMDMNATDLAALRMLIIREQHGEVVKPNDLASHLAISTASTTKLLDRLTADGYLTRIPHPHDRRARIVVLTDEARTTFRRHFGDRLRRMRTAADAYTDAELRTIVRFLADMETAMLPD